jgi:hypothetical protein
MIEDVELVEVDEEREVRCPVCHLIHWRAAGDAACPGEGGL